jgi:hypothetical protein
MSLKIKRYPDLSEPILFPGYGPEVRLRFSPSQWLYVLEHLDGILEPLNGVTSTVHIIDKSAPLMAWAVKRAMMKLRATLLTKHLGPNGAIEIFESELDKVITDAKKADREELEIAGEVGHVAHAHIEDLIKTILRGDDKRMLELLGKFPLDERAANCCVASIEWMVKHNVRWKATEQRILSLQYKFAGTLDGRALIDSCDDPFCCDTFFRDLNFIVDHKTSNYLYVEYLLQTAAYQQAHVEQTGEKIDGRVIIRLGKDDAEFEPWWALGDGLFQQDFTAFKHALELTRSLSGITGRISSVREARSVARKKIREEEKAVRMTEQCDGFKKYKGIRYPKCNKGNPCKACLKKYEETHGLLPIRKN